MRMKKLNGLLLATGAVVAFTLGSPALASASEAPEPSTETPTIEGVAPGGSETVTLGEGTTMTIEVGQAESVTASQIRNDPGLSATQRDELLGANAAAAVRSSHWSQFVTGVAYTNTQNGTFYYNGSRVWVTGSYAGYTGSHRCFNNYTVTGWQIQNISFSDTGSTTQRNLYCGWNVVQPTLITTSWSMSASVSPNGTVSGAGTST